MRDEGDVRRGDHAEVLGLLERRRARADPEVGFLVAAEAARLPETNAIMPTPCNAAGFTLISGTPPLIGEVCASGPAAV